MWTLEERARGAWLLAVTIGLAPACGRVTDSGQRRVGDGVDSGTGGTTQGTGGASANGGRSSGRGGTRSSQPNPAAGASGRPEADAHLPDAGDRPQTDASPMDGDVDGALSASARVLLGNYDVWITDPQVPNCKLAASVARLNLVVTTKDGVLTTYFFEDSLWSYAAATDITLEPGRLTVSPVSLLADPPLDPRPRLVLRWGPSGFDTQAEATLPLSCDDGSMFVATTGARIEPDRTPPRLIARPYTDVGRVFPYTYTAFSVTEPARLESISTFYPDPEDIDVRTQVALVNTDTLLPIPLAYRGFPWIGPETDVVFQDQESVVGVTFRATPVNLTDLAGNAALPDDHTYQVSSAGPVVTKVDFDEGPHPSVYGPATYVAPGSPGAPCESGGCLVMEGEIASCDAAISVDAPALVTRFGFTQDQPKATLRYRIWTKDARLLSLRVVSDVGCEEQVYVRVQPLAPSDGAYAYASAWEDASLGPCLGPNGKNPLVVTLPCIYNNGVTPEPARFVVESIVLDPPVPPPVPPIKKVIGGAHSGIL